MKKISLVQWSSFDWDRSKERMKFFIENRDLVPNILIANEAELLLTHYYGGFCRMLLNVIWNHITYGVYGILIRLRIF
jgi:hypothetical protein